MKEDIRKMQERHEKEIAELQDSCPHKEHYRSSYMWAPGHFGNDVEVCSFCGKILTTYDIDTVSQQPQITCIGGIE